MYSPHLQASIHAFAMQLHNNAVESSSRQKAEHGIVPVQGTQKLKLGRSPFSDAGKGSGTKAIGTSFLRSARKDPNIVRSSQHSPPATVAPGPGMHTQHSLAIIVGSPVCNLQWLFRWLKVVFMPYRSLWRAQPAGWAHGL